MLKGQVISPGYAVGQAFCIKHFYLDNVISKPISPNQLDSEIARLNQAIKLAKSEIQRLLELPHIKNSYEISNIFEAHLLLLEDPDLKKEIEKRLRSQLVNLESIIAKVIKDFSSFFKSLPDPQFQSKAIDIIDVGQRLLRNCEGGTSFVLPNELNKDRDGIEGFIIIANDLAPSDLADIDPKSILGLALQEGTPASHASILAKSMNIPALIQVKNLLKEVTSNKTIILDAVKGIIFPSPNPDQITNYKLLRSAYLKQIEDTKKIIYEEPITKDNVRITLLANIGKAQDIDQVISYNADGIGLYRTEFTYLFKRSFPTEDELVDIFKHILSKLPHKEITIRTTDLGGDKLPYITSSTLERNPELGWRAIRMALQIPQLFHTQIRAIIKAIQITNHAQTSILLPMISTYEELISAKGIILNIIHEIQNQNGNLSYLPKVGIMVEVPSTAILLEHFIKEVDFISIGTNDLIQYTLAVDRTNPNVAHLYQPSNPAILKLLKQIVYIANENNKRVSICGELACESRYIPLLIGLGIKELSMTPNCIPNVKMAIRTITTNQAQTLADSALKCASNTQVEKLLDEFWNTLR